MATDKIFDLGVMAVDEEGNVFCDGRFEPKKSIVSRGDDLLIVATDGAGLKLNGDIELVFQSPAGNIIFDENNGVIMRYIPTSDPGVADALWNDSGTLKISAG